jgi:hypothetical protein
LLASTGAILKWLGQLIFTKRLIAQKSETIETLALHGFRLTLKTASKQISRFWGYFCNTPYNLQKHLLANIFHYQKSLNVDD